MTTGQEHMYKIVGFWQNLLGMMYSLSITFLAPVEGYKEGILGLSKICKASRSW